jgi:hypothetical protein
MASGAPPALGLITGIVGGLVERCGRRSSDPAKTAIPALMQRPAA